jgi:hypothetical protein
MIKKMEDIELLKEWDGEIYGLSHKEYQINLEKNIRKGKDYGENRF